MCVEGGRRARREYKRREEGTCACYLLSYLCVFSAGLFCTVIKAAGMALFVLFVFFKPRRREKGKPGKPDRPLESSLFHPLPGCTRLLECLQLLLRDLVTVILNVTCCVVGCLERRLLPRLMDSW